MKDLQGRTIVIGNTVLFSTVNGLVMGVVTDMADGKVTLQKTNGKTSTVTHRPEKFYLLG